MVLITQQQSGSRGTSTFVNTRPQSPKPGTLWKNLGTNEDEIWNGSQWVRLGKLDQILSAFGSGADGEVTISANTEMTSDKNYKNLTINSGFTLDTNGYVLRVSGTLTLTGDIISNGFAGDAGSDATSRVGALGASGGTQTHASATLSDSMPGRAGGNGGAGHIDSGSSAGAGLAGSAGSTGTSITRSIGSDGSGGGSGGVGGHATACAGNAVASAGGTSTPGTATAITNIELFEEARIDPTHVQTESLETLHAGPAGGGGGGGGAACQTGGRGEGGGGGGGGGSGSGGGNMSIHANIVIGAGNFIATGGAGGAGGVGADGIDANGSGGGGGGGGAGGSGGYIKLTTRTSSGWSGSATVTGGASGAGGLGGSSTGAPATNGSPAGSGGVGVIGKFLHLSLDFL